MSHQYTKKKFPTRIPREYDVAKLNNKDLATEFKIF